jgi:hypothetical protein
MDAVLDDRRSRTRLASQDAALARLLARDFDGTLLGFVDEVLRRRRAAPEVPWDFWEQFDGERARGTAQYRPALFRRCRRTATEGEPGAPCRGPGAPPRMIVNQWVPGRAPRATRSATAPGGSATCCAGRATSRSSTRSRSTRTCAATSGRSDDPTARTAGRRDDLPLRAALADDRGVRHAAGRARAAVPQHHARRRSSRRTTPGLFRLAALGRRELAVAGRPRGPGARRLGVQPAGARALGFAGPA